MRLTLLLATATLCCACGGGGGGAAPAAPVQPVTAVALNQAALSLTAGSAPTTLTVTVSPANATNPAVAWSTSNSGVATVAGGAVTPVGPGSATITVTTVDGAKTAACTVTVTVSTTCPIPVAKASPSWTADIYPALQSSCGSAAISCHGGSSPTGHVSYSGSAATVYAQLVGVVPANAPTGQGWLRVKAGDSAHSWIIEKVTKDQPGGTGYGARMPYAAPNLCQPTVDTLSAWISAGALNN